MQNWVLVLLSFVAGGCFGYLLSEKLNNDKRIAALSERMASLETPQNTPVAPLPQRAVPPSQRRITNVSISDSPVRGADDAPVTIIVFSDFQCPYCARVNPTLERLLDNYPEQVRLVFKHSPLPMHPNAKVAHRASIAAAQQNNFWQMHDKIFGNIRDVSRNTLLGYARDLELDMERFTHDIDLAPLLAKLDAEIAESQKLGITGTPTFFINGKIVTGAQPYENFQALVERELAHSVN